MSKTPILFGIDLAAGESVSVSTPGWYITSEGRFVGITGEGQSVVFGDCSAPAQAPLASMTGEPLAEPAKPQERLTLHLEGDGRGPREVFVNGLLIEGVTMADTMLGIVEYCPKPVTVGPDGNIIRKRKYGKVRVKYHADERQG